MNVHDIIQAHLKEIGAEGLANGDEECGCDIDDLAPCGEACMGCIPAHRCLIPDMQGGSITGYVGIGSSHRYIRAPRQASNPEPTRPASDVAPATGGDGLGSGDFVGPVLGGQS